MRSSSVCAILIGNIRHLPSARHNPVQQVHGGAKTNTVIYRQGEATEDVFVLCQGWAVRLIQLPNGRRQILSVLLPGDLFSATTLFADRLHYSVQAATEVRFSRFARVELNRVMANPDALAQLGKVCATEHRRMDELATDLGQRSAEERIAHLIIHLVDRISARAMGSDRSYPFPLRQRHIADITGLTPVHVSRVITQFRRANYFELSKGTLVLRNRVALERIGRLG
ncbi:MAG: Crp/Fnr family transcriptional regulator [Hyphomicrobium sp.]|uniref:Crp/Fnr family transcriptional regulator n=1 Tax=Hyphomicrobium sp. TaxID=82 RepID=UPI0025C353F4|nr:Crp/Fnr family transcriptional regulator [Hyphomicrobium sp.]MBZ0211220.1 Crp/Fnr family transcriptional regulator [Hyphomicrobium sp.]